VLAREASLGGGAKDSASDPDVVTKFTALHDKYEVRTYCLLGIHSSVEYKMALRKFA
jgi:hypothetical protein